MSIKSLKKAYLKSVLFPKISILNFKDTSQKYDVAFILPEIGKGWILEGICKEIAKYYSGDSIFCYDLINLPFSKIYFFAHYMFFREALLQNKSAAFWRSNKIVWHTHQDEKHGISIEETVYLLNLADTVVCANSADVKLLETMGVRTHKLTCVLGGADPTLFKYHDRQKRIVGICTAYYPRKNPDLIYTVIKSSPEFDFLLLGRNWQQYEKIEELEALENFRYVEAPYTDYPQYYNEMSVFLSLSKLEGGPIPLVEAMMSNVVPVATNTGFAPDFIQHGENGYLLDKNSADIGIIQNYIHKAFTIKTNIRETVEKYSWENFSKEIQKYFK